MIELGHLFSFEPLGDPVKPARFAAPATQRGLICPVGNSSMKDLPGEPFTIYGRPVQVNQPPVYAKGGTEGTLFSL